MKGRINIDRERCKGCELCMTVCPKKKIGISKKLNTKGYYPAEFSGDTPLESEKTGCTGCSLCAIICPDVAIEVYREDKE